MPNLPDLVAAETRSWVVGTPAPTDIFLRMPANSTTLHFRRKGDILTSEDLETIRKIAPENVLCPKGQLRLPKLSTAGHELASTLAKAGSPDAPEVRKAATQVLAELNSGKEDPVELLNLMPGIVEEIMAEFRSNPAIAAFEKALQKMRNEKDPLATHNQQVSALSVLILLTAGGASMDELADIGTAGLIHDVGLRGMPAAILEGHLTGSESLSPTDKLLYMRHAESALEAMRKLKIQLSPGVQRTLLLHHENWDGSGFKGMLGTEIFRPARILRIADELVSQMNRPGASRGFAECARALAGKTGKGGRSVYDPDIVAVLLQPTVSKEAA